MIKVSLKNVEAEFSRIRKEVKAEASKKLIPIAAAIVKELKEVTPVDTGNARDKWSLNGNVIYNTAPYIINLNEGSSKQAPSHFIEAVCMKHGKPKGAIVTIYPDT